MSVVHELQTVLCWKSVVILVCWPQRTRGCSIHVTVADPSAVHLGQSGLPFYIRRGYAFTEGEWQNWFCSFLGVPLPSMMALIADNRKCPCGRPYDAHAHHVNTCIHCNKTRAHNLLQDCLMSIVRDTDFTVTTRVPTIEVNDRQLRADIYLPQMVVGVGRGLCIDVSRVHDFHGNAANPSQNGTLRHADRVTEWNIASCGHSLQAWLQWWLEATCSEMSDAGARIFEVQLVSIN